MCAGAKLLCNTHTCCQPPVCVAKGAMVWWLMLRHRKRAHTTPGSAPSLPVPSHIHTPLPALPMTTRPPAPPTTHSHSHWHSFSHTHAHIHSSTSPPRNPPGIDVSALRNKGVEAREARDRALTLQHTGSGPERLAESSAALQRKAALYDRLAARGGGEDDEEDDRYEVCVYTCV